MKFLGIPLVVWGVICLALTLVWLWVWPSDRVAVEMGWRFIVLRWFHALTWLLLAMAAFAGASKRADGRLARLLGLAALGVYLVFMATFVFSS